MTNPEFPEMARAHFYSRIANGLHGLIQQQEMAEWWKANPPIRIPDELIMETQQMIKAIKVNIQEALERLQFCPICGCQLTIDPGFNEHRVCHCGQFTITDVYLDGDVGYQFVAINPEEVEYAPDCSAASGPGLPEDAADSDHEAVQG